VAVLSRLRKLATCDNRRLALERCSAIFELSRTAIILTKDVKLRRDRLKRVVDRDFPALRRGAC
jgi:hypothetical protein